MLLTFTLGVNNHPVAICSNKTVSVDQKLVTLDASQSKDDAGIVSYKWTPLDANPAAMV